MWSADSTPTATRVIRPFSSGISACVPASPVNPLCSIHVRAEAVSPLVQRAKPSFVTGTIGTVSAPARGAKQAG